MRRRRAAGSRLDHRPPGAGPAAVTGSEDYQNFQLYDDVCHGVAHPHAPAYTASGPHPVAYYYDDPHGGGYGYESSAPNHPWDTLDIRKVQLVVCVTSTDGPAIRSCGQYGGTTATLARGNFFIRLYESRTARPVAGPIRLDGAPSDQCPQYLQLKGRPSTLTLDSRLSPDQVTGPAALRRLPGPGAGPRSPPTAARPHRRSPAACRVPIKERCRRPRTACRALRTLVQTASETDSWLRHARDRTGAGFVACALMQASGLVVLGSEGSFTRRLAALAAATVLALLIVIAGKSGGRPVDAAAVARVGDTVTATGPKITLIHGIVQARVTITGGRITDAVALSLLHDNLHSWAGSSGAAVKLRAEVLAKRTGKIDIISGATYTSRGYIRSLQAALDAAGHHRPYARCAVPGPRSRGFGAAVSARVRSVWTAGGCPARALRSTGRRSRPAHIGENGANIKRGSKKV